MVDFSTGQVVMMLQSDEIEVEPSDGQNAREVILTFCVNPKANVIVTASRNNLLRKWDVDFESTPPQARSVRAIKGHTEPVLCMDFDSTGTFVATGSADRTARVWDMRGGFATHNFRGHGGIVSLVQFHPDAARLILVTSCDDCSTRLWSLHDKACVATLTNHMSPVTCVAFTEDGYTMATGARDKVVNFWELRRHTLLRTLPVYEDIEGLAILDPADHESSEKKRKREDSSGVLVVVGSKGVARAWSFWAKDHAVLAQASRAGGRDDLLACSVIATQDPPKGEAIPYTGLLVRPWGLLAMTAHHNLVVLDRSTLCPIRQLVGYNDEVIQIKYLPGLVERLAVATNSPQLKLLRISDFSCELFEGHTGTVLTVDVSPTGKHIVTGSKDHTCRLWTVSGATAMVCVGHTREVSSVALSRRESAYDSGSAFFISGGGDCTLKRWKVDSLGSATVRPTAERSVRAHEKEINHVCVAPNDALVATSSQARALLMTSEIMPNHISTDLSL